MKSRSIFATLLQIIAISLGVTVILTVYFIYQLSSMLTKSEDLLYNQLYAINTTLINADRDFYQAMTGAQKYREVRSDNTIPEEAVLKLLPTYLDEYNENTSQTIERVTKASEIARNNSDLYIGTTIDSGKTYNELYNEFIKDIKNWQTLYNIETGQGDWSNFVTSFEEARNALSEMQDIVEMWAIQEKTENASSVQRSVAVSAVLAVLITVIVLVYGVSVFKKIAKTIRGLSGEIEKLSNGELKLAIDEKALSRKDELGLISNSTKGLSEKLSNIVDNIKASAAKVGSNSNELAGMADQISQTATDVANAVQEIASGATQQADEIQDATNSVGQIGDAVAKVQNSSEELERLAGRMKEASESSTKSLSGLQTSSNKMTVQIDNISETIQRTQDAVDAISEKVEGITNIATQTNLLSLNASIEAARAGDAGKGFAVVAQEIGKLAEDSKAMADEIKKEMDSLMEQSKAAVEAADDVKKGNLEQQNALGETITAINGMINDIGATVEGVKDISNGAALCENSKNAVSDVMSALSAISEENAASSEETGASMQELSATVTTLASSADGLKNVSEQLNRDMMFFR